MPISKHAIMKALIKYHAYLEDELNIDELFDPTIENLEHEADFLIKELNDD